MPLLLTRWETHISPIWWTNIAIFNWFDLWTISMYTTFTGSHQSTIGLSYWHKAAKKSLRYPCCNFSYYNYNYLSISPYYIVIHFLCYIVIHFSCYIVINFSSAPSSNFYKKRRRATLLVKYSVLGNMSNACIFLMIWYFRMPSSFSIFSDENQDIYFSWPKFFMNKILYHPLISF